MKIKLLIFTCFWVYPAWAQQEVERDTSKGPMIVERLFDTADKVVELISGKSWTFIPALTYSPETSLGIGVRALKIFRHQQGSATRPSSWPITLLYTLNKQLIFTTGLDLWMNENSGHFNGRLEFSDYPFKFYGIGNNVVQQTEEFYATRYAHLQLVYQKRIASGIYLGPQYEFRLDDIYKTEDGGLLDNGKVPGSEGQRVSGVGLVLSFDTRNNIFQPEKGTFHQASFISYQGFLGSNYNFNHYQLDFRKYMATFRGQVLAVQAWYSFTSGQPPFQQLSMMGGSDLMRGYFEGRYRDGQAMVYQAEYRMPVYRKLALVLFGSAGQVSDKISSYALHRFRYGGGMGFRYKLTDDGLNFRLDIAFGDQAAFYLGLDEVF